MSREGKERRKTDSMIAQGSSADCRSEDGDGEPGMRTPLRKMDPKMASEDERREHELTHLPFRAWCAHCIKGKGREDPHRSWETVNTKPKVSWDYMYLLEKPKNGKKSR